MTTPSYTCPVCGSISYHQKDIEHRYCARCHRFEDDPGVDIFVFGSNLAGRHGKGAALYALQHRGAQYGQGIGLQGLSYAIPTKDEHLRSLPLAEIGRFVEQFLTFAKEHPKLQFEVTPIGCGLAGYRPVDIAPMFERAPGNVRLPGEFLRRLAS